MFVVVELWMEGRQLMETLTPEMENEYRATMSAEKWQSDAWITEIDPSGRITSAFTHVATFERRCHGIV